MIVGMNITTHHCCREGYAPKVPLPPHLLLLWMQVSGKLKHSPNIGCNLVDSKVTRMFLAQNRDEDSKCGWESQVVPMDVRFSNNMKQAMLMTHNRINSRLVKSILLTIS